MIFKFKDSLAEGEHELLKFGITGFAFVMGYQLVLMMADIVQETGGKPGLDSMTGNFVWIFGTAMIVVFTYFLYSIVIRFLDWRNWRKNKNPFNNTERRFFR